MVILTPFIEFYSHSPHKHEINCKFRLKLVLSSVGCQQQDCNQLQTGYHIDYSGLVLPGLLIPHCLLPPAGKGSVGSRSYKICWVICAQNGGVAMHRLLPHAKGNQTRSMTSSSKSSSTSSSSPSSSSSSSAAAASQPASAFFNWRNLIITK